MNNLVNSDLDISKLSYTYKDFASIYPEMLKIVNQLTDKWDPSQSNESDPGVVLIKEAAFVADHNNYNIDKNVLENFLPSATQDKSVRNIVEMNGYTPGYYVSANDYITFKYTAADEDKEKQHVFTIPAFTLVISSDDETVSYTQVEDMVVSGDGSLTTCRFIEGTLQNLAINDSNIITMENIDNNRVYLPETMVAQNGIYIKNVSELDYADYWERDNFLLTKPAGSHIFKLDYDSDLGLAYIEFPTDIANLIGDGLSIQYIATSGLSGNVSAYTLTKILSPSTFKAIDEDDERQTSSFTLWNASAITNGKDPETINEMYQSFKRIVGTFDTLVTCKDYSNKIYSLADDYDNSYVSNVVVTDRRIDYNKSQNVITYDVDKNIKLFKNISISKKSEQSCALFFKGKINDPTELQDNTQAGLLYFCTSDNKLYVTLGKGDYEEAPVINLNDFSVLTEAMTPYDISIYALKTYLASDYSSIDQGQALRNSFTEITGQTLKDIQSELEDVKCISHNYNDPADGDIICFKNKTPLKITVIPYKNTRYEEWLEIKDNIFKALSENYNPRHLEYGEKLDETLIKDTIINADDRIKAVDMDRLKYTPYALYHGGNEINILDQDSTLLLDLVAKNVLAGRLCLFNFDDDFDFNYGQVNGVIYDNVNYVNTALRIPLVSSSNASSSGNSETYKETDITFDNNDFDIKYALRALNHVDAGGNLIPIQANESYTLVKGTEKTRDELYIQLLDKTTKAILTDGIYYSTDDTSVTINSDQQLTNGRSKKPSIILNGVLNVTKKQLISNVDDEKINLTYTLNDNEAIQIIYPNYYSDKTYSVYVNYRFEGSENSKIISNTEYTLKPGEKLIFQYSKDGETKTDIYAGSNSTNSPIINSNFDILPTGENGTNKTYIDTTAGNAEIEAKFKTLSSSQSVSTRKILQTKLDSTGIWMYWIINSTTDGKNTLFTNDGSSTDTERVLGQNEYFIYTNSSLNEMVILGSGTKLNRSTSESAMTIESDFKPTISSISNNGTSTTIPWVKNVDLNFDPIYITEMNIITLGPTDSIEIRGWNNTPSELTNTFVTWNPLSDNSVITYIINGEPAELKALTNFYKIRSRLDLNIGPGLEQKLVGYQEVVDGENIIKPKIDEYSQIPVYLQASTQIVGIGETIDCEDDSRLYCYEKDNEIYKRSIKVAYVESTDRVWGRPYRAGEYIKTDFKFTTPDIGFDYIIPIHISGNEIPINISFDPEIEIKDYPNKELSESLSGDTSYYITFRPTSVIDELVMTISFTSNKTTLDNMTSNESIYVDDITVIKGLDVHLKNLGLSLSDILNKIDLTIEFSDKPSLKPYYPYRLDNSIAINNINIDYNNIANILWDVNNVANRITLPQLDIDTTNNPYNIDLTNSRKYGDGWDKWSM